MQEESKENKAKKLAAARKKLKEYQQRGSASGANAASSYTYADSPNNSGHVSSNISERSESELQLNGSNFDINHIESAAAIELPSSISKEDYQVNYLPVDQQLSKNETNKNNEGARPALDVQGNHSDGMHNINAIQVLITEKSQLNMELSKFRNLCREKDLEMEELRVQHTNATKRVEELNQRLVDFQKQQDQQKLHNAELQHKLAQARAQQEDHSSHVNELKQQLTLRDERLKKLEADFKDKLNELELSQLRVRQLSDENNITKDNRVETLTQTQFMYEQQIRDLQAMVQQLTQDKDQANTQYQTYVQQLNAQVQQLSERNSELTDETTKFQEREKQWVDHIQQLEKEIQKNITKQAEAQEAKESSSVCSKEQFEALQERINDFDSERYEFQLKIKSQEDRLNTLQQELKQKDVEAEQLKEHLENITAEQPDKTKLLAIMESDKVAASRALTQNVELKKQLDELESRFVQLTNDKADLMTRLDSEQHANREMHTNYSDMQERLKTIDERFKFKDEEMIRLSHENEELKKKLQSEKICNKEDSEDIDHHSHTHDHHNGLENERHQDHGHDHTDGHEECSHDNNHHKNSGEHKLDHGNMDCHDHKHEEENHSNTEPHTEPCVEATEEKFNSFAKHQLQSENKINTKSEVITTPRIATEEAVEKLQQRFTQLMTQCADLTEEKQRLEHLVTQLQSETETIGEYIALYQTQRRILKQREYEKAAQTAMLQAEREQMHQRLTLLNNLVNHLGMELPQNQLKKQEINEAINQNTALAGTGQFADPTNSRDLVSQNAQTPARDFNSPESQEILNKIQDIITEIKENTTELQTVAHPVDHLNCCSGKFEVV